MSILPKTNLPLPTMYDLPSEEVGDSGMPDQFHVEQAMLLNETFLPPSMPRDQVFSAIDMNLYYDWRHTDWYKRPDWFGVVGVPSLYEGHDMRWSYVVWHEKRPPLIVVELLSEGTEKEDLGETLREVNQPPGKWEVYERILRVPYYAVFGRFAEEPRFFKLQGKKYVELTNHGGHFRIPEAQLSLGLWHGIYNGVEHLWLRWYDGSGNLIPTREERAYEAWQHAQEERLRANQAVMRAEQETKRAEQEANRAEQQAKLVEQERLRAEQEQLRAEQEKQRAERLAEKLRQLGFDPEQL